MTSSASLSVPFPARARNEGGSVAPGSVVHEGPRFQPLSLFSYVVEAALSILWKTMSYYPSIPPICNTASRHVYSQ
jgi:hypothetical protein